MEEKIIIDKRPSDEVVLKEVLGKVRKNNSLSYDELKESEEFTVAQAYLISKKNSKLVTTKAAQWLFEK